jgi:hypothetical protein
MFPRLDNDSSFVFKGPCRHAAGNAASTAPQAVFGGAPKTL